MERLSHGLPSMDVRLFNSLSRSLETFQPLDPDRVTMYVCGPTVYNYIHIGNARPAVVFGTLANLLRRRYGGVVYARNITDVDDKINAAAKAAGVPIGAITTRFAQAYRDDMAALGVPAPDLEPLATAHIPHIIAMIERLIASGHAYAAEGHVLFSVATYPDYGQLSRRDMDEMLAGARVEVAPYKRDPADFVLWKPSTPDLPGWDSPWGRGRPGWHIECSAMAEAHLGETIDIHAGGVDLQFPHHENEIAQSACAHGGKTFARYWLHNGMLTFDGAKMSKSVGNVSLAHDLLAKYPPEALRLALLSAHYRQPLDWSEGLIEQSVRTLDRLYGTLRDLADIPVDGAMLAVPEAVEAALSDDINTPDALAVLAGIAGAARKADSPADRQAAKLALLGGGMALGLLQQEPEAWFQGGRVGFGDSISVGFSFLGGELKSIDDLIDERQQARARRDFAEADRIRDFLAEQGIQLEDTPQGVRWRRAG